MTDEITQLIIENEKLIHKITHYFSGYHSKEDLFQVGVIGLINAYKNFDDSMGVKFTTYAYSYIVGEMKKQIREDRGVKISRDILKLNLKIDKAIILLSQKLMREPSCKEISSYLEMPEYMIAQSMNLSSVVQSLDEPVVRGESKDLNLYDTIPQIESMDLNSLIMLKEELNGLPENEQAIIKMRYFDDLTQMEVANNIGVNQVQVSRQEKKVLQKLRKNLHELDYYSLSA